MPKVNSLTFEADRVFYFEMTLPVIAESSSKQEAWGKSGGDLWPHNVDLCVIFVVALMPLPQSRVSRIQPARWAKQARNVWLDTI